MQSVKKQYVIDESGERIAVQLDIETFQELEEYIEMLEDRIELELAMKEPTEFTNWDEFVKELREEGKL
jgi:DUF2075 family protein